MAKEWHYVENERTLYEDDHPIAVIGTMDIDLSIGTKIAAVPELLFFAQEFHKWETGEYSGTPVPPPYKSMVSYLGTLAVEALRKAGQL